MKILHCVRSVNPAGGGPIEGIKQLGRVLTEMGHSIEIASLDEPGADFLQTVPFGVYPLGVSRFGLARIRYGFSPRFKGWLRRNANKYDLVVVNGLWQFHSVAVWSTLRNSDTPYVVFTHGMLDPWFRHAYPLKHLKKWPYWLLAEYWVLRGASAVLFTSEDERLLARESFSLYRAKELVISYGTSGPNAEPEAQKSEFFRRFPALRNKRLALFLGRIHPKKGCDLAITAFAEVLAGDDDWHLVMAGPDQVGWQTKLSNLASELNIGDRITWAGMLAGDLKWGAFRAAEIFLLPSHQENFGIVVAEALACGVPALLSRKVNIWREIQAGGAGLVEADDLNGTCMMLRKWVSMPDSQKRQMRDDARKCFESHFNIRRSVSKLLESYSAVAAGKQLAPKTIIPAQSNS